MAKLAQYNIQTLSQYKLVLNADQLPSLGMHTQQNTRLANKALQQLKGLPLNPRLN